MDPTSQALRRFPLVARPRPAAKALSIRVNDLCALADRAARASDLAAASAVYNQAALIASDCGQPELARLWCHQHAAAYLRTLPLAAQAARHALEPLVNLARLHTRDGNGDAALGLLTDLYQAVSSRTDTLIDGQPLPASRLTRAADDHRQVRQWLWAVLLADGARALTTAGRWREAHYHLQQNNGIGHRMLDGRQVAVIAHATTGQIERARSLIAETVAGEPWEEAVTLCLAYLCNKGAGESEGMALGELLRSHRQLTSAPSRAVFHNRLGLTVLDAVGVDHPDVRCLAADLINQALTSDDAYIARDLLHHRDVLTVVDASSRAKLAEILQTSGMADRGMPNAAHERLLQALTVSNAAIQDARAAAMAPTQADQ